MSDEPRKASDILLALENKIDNIYNIIKQQDQLIKILSNKINDLNEKANNTIVQTPKFTVEAANGNNLIAKDPIKNISISSEDNIPEETNPVGARRNSRPETYQEKNTSNKVNNKEQAPKMPIQVIKPSGQVEIVPPNIPKATPPPIEVSENKIPVSQRVINKNGKSIFLAEFEIFDQATKTSIHKGRTTAAGKWQTPLKVGTYKVIVRKRENMNEPTLEAVQEIIIDGKTSPMELGSLILK